MPLDSKPYQEWLDGDGEVYVTFHRKPGGYVVRFIDRLDYHIETASGAVTCVPANDKAGEMADHLFANQIVPLMQNHAGELVLHGSAVACKGAALGFVGQSGRGKSTLAAAFAHAGHPFLTEDGLLLKPVGASYLSYPSWPNLRLWQDSEHAVFKAAPADGNSDALEKRQIEAGPSLPFQCQPLRLRNLYVLGPGECSAATIKQLTPAEAFTALLRHTFILDCEDRHRMRGHFERIGQLVDSISCFALDYPRRYDMLPKLIEVILAHAQTGEPVS